MNTQFFLSATYSNLENHPRIIRVNNSKQIPKINLDPRTGLPLMNSLPRNPTRRTATIENDSDDTETGAPSECLLVAIDSVISLSSAYKRITISRPRNESKEDKKARKMTAKTEKQNRRVERQEMKEQFAAELKVQKRMLANKSQRVKRM